MRTPIVGSIVLVALLLSSEWLTGGAGASERARPIRIGALTWSWGPTPALVGLREELLEHFPPIAATRPKSSAPIQ